MTSTFTQKVNKNSRINGKGTLTLSDGTTYEGDFLNGRLHCKNGKVTLPNGSRYKGGVKYGMFWGNGEIILASGDKYVGKFKKGMYWNYTKIFL